MAYQIREFVFNCPSRKGSLWPGLSMTAKRYSPSGIPQADGLTLLFFHCNGTHKEQWEPVIESLFSQSTSNQVKIREAWALDEPAHGEAAILNQRLLEKGTESVSLYDWVPGVFELLQSKYFQGHRVVLCGHSLGATAAVLVAIEFCPSPASAGIIGLVLVEPTMMTLKDSEAEFLPRLSRLIAGSYSRKDNWKSRKEALLYFRDTYPWRKWDPQVLRLYVEHGLHERDDGTVTLKCDKMREVEGFAELDPHIDGLGCLGKLCHAIPVHIIWGEQQDFVPGSIRAALSDASGDRPMASVTNVERAGHMVIQEQPIRFSQAIYHILNTMPSASPNRSRL